MDLASGEDTVITHYNSSTEDPQRLLTSPDGRYMALFGLTAEVWDVETGGVVWRARFAEGTNPTHRFFGAFAPSGPTLYAHGVVPGAVARVELLGNHVGDSWASMTKPMPAGIKIVSETQGEGEPAERGDIVTISYTLSLNRGEVVQAVDSCRFTLGTRNVIAGLVYGVEGLRVGGQRCLRVSPHLAYRDQGVPGTIPANAVLIFDVKLLSTERTSD